MHRGLLKFSILFFSLVGRFSFCPFEGHAQGLINNGANIVVSGSGQIYINEGAWTNNGTFSGATSTVTFAGATAQSIAGTNSTTFYNLTAAGAGTKTFNTSSSVSRLVSVGDNATINANGKLTLLATSTTNASVGPLLNGASIINNTIVQSYFTGGDPSYRAFRGVSSPINDAAVIGDKTYKQLQSKLIITGGSTLNGFDKGNSTQPFAVVVKTYNEAAPKSGLQFTNLTSTTQSTTPGKGFFLYYRGSRFAEYDQSGTYATGAKVVAPFATPENVIVEYTGPINQGTVTVPLSYTDHGDSDNFTGVNLVGNPYPSVIDWDAVRSASTNGGTNISPYIYLIKQDGSFVTQSANPLLSQTGASQYIMPGQAFYVQATSSGINLNFTEACKSPYPAGTVMRYLSAPGNSDFISGGVNFSKPAILSSLPLKVMRLNVQNQNKTEETIIAFRSDANESFKISEDGVYFGGGELTFCSRSKDNKNLSVNISSEPTEKTEVALYVGASRPGELKLAATDLSMLDGMQLFLKDAYLNKIENLTITPTYTFEVNNSIPASYGSGRFKLLFRPTVVLSDFSASKIYGGSEIKWSGAGRVESGSFIVERSTDGQNFTVIGTIQKVDDNHTPYTFLDSKPATGINYYRLKLPETDQLFSYTNTISLTYEIDSKDPNYIIYPNPVKEVLNVIFREPVQRGELAIYNLTGQKLKTFAVSNSNKATCSLNDLQAGVYVLKVVDGNGKDIGTEKFIKD